MYRYLYLAAGFEEMKEISRTGRMKQIYNLNLKQYVSKTN